MQSNLLRNFIEDADRAVDERHRGASLRFGHESVLLPLVCLMGLNGADYQTSDLEHLHEHWQSCRIFPMACNVQMVFFQSATHPDDVLVKVLLNEREATLPVTTDCAPYYHCDEEEEDEYDDEFNSQGFGDNIYSGNRYRDYQNNRRRR